MKCKLRPANENNFGGFKGLCVRATVLSVDYQLSWMKIRNINGRPEFSELI